MPFTAAIGQREQSHENTTTPPRHDRDTRRLRIHPLPRIPKLALPKRWMSSKRLISNAEIQRGTTTLLTKGPKLTKSLPVNQSEKVTLQEVCVQETSRTKLRGWDRVYATKAALSAITHIDDLFADSLLWGHLYHLDKLFKTPYGKGFRTRLLSRHRLWQCGDCGFDRLQLLRRRSVPTLRGLQHCAFDGCNALLVTLRHCLEKTQCVHQIVNDLAEVLICPCPQRPTSFS